MARARGLMKVRAYQKTSPFGMSRNSFMNAASCQGNAISYLPLSRPRMMCCTASSTGTMNGIGNLLLALIGVATKPGLMTLMVTPLPRRPTRRLSARLITAAFDGPYAAVRPRPR